MNTKHSVYASSREITNALAARDDGEDLTPRQALICGAADADRLHVHDERASGDVQYAGGGYAMDSRGNYREYFC